MNHNRIPALFLFAAAALLAIAAPAPVGQSQSGEWLYLPLAMLRWPPVPEAPILAPIDNSDLNNAYQLSWSPATDAQSYVLQESPDPSFTTVVEAPDLFGTALDLSDKTPATYYYRVAGVNSYGRGQWSNVIAVTIYPLFVGLQIRWDGNGYIRTDDVFDVGTHEVKMFDGRTDIDILRAVSRQWYAPDPQSWGEDVWTAYYRASTGEFQTTTPPGASDWKWGYGWKLAYGASFSGGIAIIDGQVFIVTGPTTGVTAFGISYQYWEMKNRDTIVMWQNGDWAQVLEPSTVTLRYDAGSSHLLTYSDVLRRYYFQGQRRTETVQYVEALTAATYFNGYRGTVPQTVAASETTNSVAPGHATPPLSAGVWGPAPFEGNIAP